MELLSFLHVLKMFSLVIQAIICIFQEFHKAEKIWRAYAAVLYNHR